MIVLLLLLLVLRSADTTTSIRGSLPSPLPPPPTTTTMTTTTTTTITPPLVHTANKILKTGEQLIDQVSPTLRSTEITLRGIFMYAMKLDGECDSDTAAVARLGGEGDTDDNGLHFNSTSSLPILLKFQRLAIGTKEDVISTKKAHKVLMVQRSSMEKDVRRLCSSMHRTLDVWMDEKKFGSGSGGGGVSLVDMGEENQNQNQNQNLPTGLETGRVKAKETLIDQPSNELMMSAEEIIRETRVISQKRLRNMHLSQSPLKIKRKKKKKKTDVIVITPFPELKMKAMILNLCEHPSSILQKLVRLNRPLPMQQTIKKMTMFQSDLQQLVAVVLNLKNVELDHVRFFYFFIFLICFLISFLILICGVTIVLDLGLLQEEEDVIVCDVLFISI